jgi:hypothetical protein
MSNIKDSRLWLTCLLTVVGTALFGVTFHGALGHAQSQQAPAVPGSPASPLEVPYSASLTHGG